MNAPCPNGTVVELKNVVKRFTVGEAEVTILKGVSRRVVAASPVRPSTFSRIRWMASFLLWVSWLCWR